MKGVALCSDQKKCSRCSHSLTLNRKNMNWVGKRSGVTRKKQTNVYSCQRCQIDHIIKGNHIDKSDWETLELPLINPNTTSYRSYSNKSSEVKTYYDPSVKNNPTLKKHDSDKASVNKQSNEDTHAVSALDKLRHKEQEKRKLGIYLVNSE